MKFSEPTTLYCFEDSRMLIYSGLGGSFLTKIRRLHNLDIISQEIFMCLFEQGFTDYLTLVPYECYLPIYYERQQELNDEGLVL